MNIKKMFTTLSAMVVAVTMTLPSASVFAATYSQELQDAYDWAYGKGVTTMSPIDNANMYGAITRAEMAKMLSVYAKEVLGKELNTSAACTFSDIDSVKGDLHDFIIESCQLGIMGQGITAFRPYDTISRAEFGTALSRVLWDKENEGGTPYYAKHLDALKANGIMNQIANAESTKEIRGYVMLMLMRSEANTVDCEDPVVALACLDPEADMYKECPAACREDAGDNTDTVVKSGDLAVTAKATESRKVVVPGVSDLDTLTFKASEKVDITKVVLERYGYSDAELVDEVRLEDQDGNVIADGKSLSKDKATLTIKKDYRATDGTLTATVVVKTTGDKVGGTLGFKVVNVESSAKNLNLDDYTPYTYDTVNYSGATVTVDIKGTKKDYNYEIGESYEIARLKVKAGSSIIYVKGFTLTNASGLDMAKFLDKLTVKVDGEDVKGLKYSVNKDDQLVISFDEMTIDMNKSNLYVISASLEDFDDYKEAVAYYLEKDSDINAVEKKTGARLTVNGNYGKDYAVVHAFNGGKIKLVNSKLGKIDASQGAEDVVVAEGTVTVTEPISKIGFTVTVDGTGKDYVTALRMFVGEDEFEAKKSGNSFTFSNVEIAESAKIQFKMDVLDNDYASGSIKFSSFNKASFNNAKYDNSREYVNAEKDVAGTISFSEVTIQSARATLKNTLSDDVEFLKGESNTGLVFNGTYTAKKALVNLSKFYINGANTLTGSEITYYLYVDDEEVASTDSYGSGSEEIFNNIKVKAGESVNIKVVAEVDATDGEKGLLTGLQLVLGGTDEFDKDVKESSAKLMNLKVVDKGSVLIEAGKSNKTVILRAKNKTLAQFTVKPAEGASKVEIESIKFNIAGADITTDDISVMLGTDELDPDEENSTTFSYTDIRKPVGENGIDVKIILDEEVSGTISLSGVVVNTKKLTKDFTSQFEDAVVRISKFEDLKGGTTKFSFKVEKKSDVMVKNLSLVFEDPSKITGNELNEEIDNNSFIQVKNTEDSDNNVMEIHYYVCPYTDEEEAEGAGESEPTYVCPEGYDYEGDVEEGTVCNSTKAATGLAVAQGTNPETYACDTGYSTTETSITAETVCTLTAPTAVAELEESEASESDSSSTDGCSPVNILRDQVQDFFLLTVDGKDQYARAFAKAK